MKRVHEVVDYVISQGMYCILNVHHDTGAHNTSWLIASGENYTKQKDQSPSSTSPTSRTPSSKAITVRAAIPR